MGPQGSAADALEAQPILDGTVAGGRPGSSHVYCDAEQEGPLQVESRSRWEQFCNDPLVRTAAVNLALILTWYLFSTLLSLFNKLVVGRDHGLMNLGPFPAPFLMSSCQFFFQHLIARALLLAGVVRRTSDGSQTWREYARKVVPNGVATGLDIGFSNYSLVYITLSFYVMCKSTTPLFLLVFAIAWGIEKPSWSLAAVVSVITAGLLLLVYGETQFHLVGFTLVMAAAMLAGLRWTITQVLLQGTPGGQGSRKHGGPVEVLYQLTPVMGFTLLLLSLGHERLWESLPASPYFASVGMTLLSLSLIFGGAVIAFAMVVAEFALIANTSALTFMVAGTFKEIVTVAAAVIFLGESFSWINGLGLLVLIAGVVLFNWMKYRKLKEDMAGMPASLPSSSAKLSEDEQGDGCLEGSGGGSCDAERTAGGGGGSYPGGSSGSEVELNAAGGPAFGISRGTSGRRSGTASPRKGGNAGGEQHPQHQVLMLGVREGFLLEDEQLLRETSPRSSGGWRGAAATSGRRPRGRQTGTPTAQHSA